MFCKNRITLIGFLGKDAETRFTPNGTAHTRFSLATKVSWKDKDSGEYKTRTEWHRIVVWGKFGEWAGSLKKGAFIEAEGELRYRSSITPAGEANKLKFLLSLFLTYRSVLGPGGSDRLEDRPGG